MLNLHKFYARQITQDISHILNGESLTLVDVGSAGGIEPRWQPIAKHLHYVGFEPDSRSDTNSKNVDSVFLSETIYPTALWDSAGSVAVYLCEKPEVSSCYLPNDIFLKRFSNAKRFNVSEKIYFNAQTLDSLDMSAADFIKIDIQGAELNALQGGVNTLTTVFGIEAEVEFMSLYSKQPLFGELSIFLEKQGFEFIDFTNLCRWDRRERNTLGQCVFGDALFLKSPEVIMESYRLRVIQLSAVRRYIAILLLYKRVDLILRCNELLKTESAGEELLKQDVALVCKNLTKKLKRLQYIRKIATKLLKLFTGGARVHLLY
jgi:FkbM family methyltransferase